MGKRAKPPGVYIPNRDIGDLSRCVRCNQLVFNRKLDQELHDKYHAGLDARPVGLEGSTDGGVIREQANRSGDTPV